MFPGAYQDQLSRKRTQQPQQQSHARFNFQNHRGHRFFDQLHMGPTLPKLQRFGYEALLPTPSTTQNVFGGSPRMMNPHVCQIVDSRILLLLFKIPQAMTVQDVHAMMKSFEGYLGCYLRFPSFMNPDSSLGFVLFGNEDHARAAEEILNNASVRVGDKEQPLVNSNFITAKVYDSLNDWCKIFTMEEVTAPEFSTVLDMSKKETRELEIPYLGQSERSINEPTSGHIREDNSTNISAMLFCSDSPYRQFSNKLYIEDIPIVANVACITSMFQSIWGFKDISSFVKNSRNETLYCYLTFVNVASAAMANIAIQKMEIPSFFPSVPGAESRFKVYFTP